VTLPCQAGCNIVGGLPHSVTVDSLAAWLNATMTSAGTGTSERLLALPLGVLWLGRLGAAAGAWFGPMLEPLVMGAWAELSESARRRQTDVLFWAIREGIPVDEMAEGINASERTQLMTGFALNAATRTAWEDKVRTLGRSLCSGLLADDTAKIDTEQMIIAAIADIEGPQLALLDFLVRWQPCQWDFDSLISGPHDISDHSGMNWNVSGREWPYPLIAYARPNLLSIAPSLL
jgi:hypothetical protein